jgi:hypothetical protein
MEKLLTIETESSTSIKHFREVCRSLDISDDTIRRVFTSFWIESEAEVVELLGILKHFRPGVYNQYEKRLTDE